MRYGHTFVNGIRVSRAAERKTSSIDLFGCASCATVNNKPSAVVFSRTDTIRESAPKIGTVQPNECCEANQFVFVCVLVSTKRKKRTAFTSITLNVLCGVRNRNQCLIFDYSVVAETFRLCRESSNVCTIYICTPHHILINAPYSNTCTSTLYMINYRVCALCTRWHLTTHASLCVRTYMGKYV